jgi:hypothetical protein
MPIGTFLRNNALLVAAAALPVLVAGFFIAASVIPRWTVAPPAYDLVFRVAHYPTSSPAKVTVDFQVRNGRVEAVVRGAEPNTYPQHWALFLFDHRAGTVRELPVELPASLPAGEDSRTIPVEGLAGREISAQPTAPDGYELRSRATSGPGLVGELFGMRRYDQHVALIKRGRTVPINLPSRFQDRYQSPVLAVGWVVSEAR